MHDELLLEEKLWKMYEESVCDDTEVLVVDFL